VLVKRVSERLKVLELSLYAFIGGLFVSLPLMLVEIGDINLGEISTSIIFGILYLGLISTALAMYLWNKSLALLEAGLVSVLFFAQPIVGVALGAIFLDESLGWTFWVGALLIGAGLIITSRTRSSLEFS
jgi:drug/metabolite transporter (DMT)-like permease